MTLRGPETQPRTQNRKLRANSFLANNTFTDELISIFSFLRKLNIRKNILVQIEQVCPKSTVPTKISSRVQSAENHPLTKIYSEKENLPPPPFRLKSTLRPKSTQKGKSPPATIPTKIYPPTKIYSKRKISSRGGGKTRVKATEGETFKFSLATFGGENLKFKYKNVFF